MWSSSKIALRYRVVAALAVVLWGIALPAAAVEVSGRIEVRGFARDLQSASVTLRDIAAVRNANTQEVAVTHPDSGGRFVFHDVPKGTYVLQVSGYGLLEEQWGARGPQLAGHALMVSTDDVRNLAIDVSARPAICGRVFAENGIPLAFSSVHAWKTDSRGGGMSQSGAYGDGASDGGNTVADRDGRYAFESLRLGYYKVGAFSPDLPSGLPNANSIFAFFDAAADADDAKPIDLTSAAAASSGCPYDIHVLPHPAASEYDGPRYRVEGQLAKSAANLENRAYEWNLQPLEGRRASMKVPFDGATRAFAFEGVQPGKYVLTLETKLPRIFSGSCFPMQRVEARQTLTVDQNIRNVRAEVLPFAVVHGSVVDVHSSNDMPIQGDANGTYFITLAGHGCARRNASADGTFTFADLEPGEYSISAEKPVYGSYTSQVEVDRRVVLVGAMQLRSGENSVTIFKRFDYGTIDARIDAGAMAGRDEYVLLLDDQFHRVDTNIGVGGVQFTGALRPGRYIAIAGANNQLMWAWADARWSDKALLEAVAAFGTSFTISPGKTTSVTLLDHTIEIQNLTADLGVAIYDR